jgi:hypothetical protein
LAFTPMTIIPPVRVELFLNVAILAILLLYQMYNFCQA